MKSRPPGLDLDPQSRVRSVGPQQPVAQVGLERAADSAAVRFENERVSADDQPSVELSKIDEALLAQIDGGTLDSYQTVVELDRLVLEGKLSAEAALSRLDPQAFGALATPSFNDGSDVEPVAYGPGVSDGCASGVVVFDPAQAKARAEADEPVILVVQEIKPEEMDCLEKVQGVICALGGHTSHTSVVARGMGIPIINNDEFLIDQAGGSADLGGFSIQENDRISIDGRTGEIFEGERAVQTATRAPAYQRILRLAQQHRRLDVHANADLPEAVKKAFELGASGIGLVRTEHMFFGERRPTLQAALLAWDDETREPFLEKIAAWQQEDFERIFESAQGKSVAIRLIDPPRHEILPAVPVSRNELSLTELAESFKVDPALLRREFETIFGDYDKVDVGKLFVRVNQESEEIIALGKALELSPGGIREMVGKLVEKNPMMGMRGVRLGIECPSLYDTQIESIFRAAAQVQTRGGEAVPHITIPMVGLGLSERDPETGEFQLREVTAFKERIETIKARVEERTGATLDYELGAMIETPAAALHAHLLSRVVDYFSFGTNDLTQLTLGLDRDNSAVIPTYQEAGIVKTDPFRKIDESVATLVSVAVWYARNAGEEAQPEFPAGVCGEQGADPDSIRRFADAGVDYVSVSSSSIPTALVASAQQTIRERRDLDAAVRETST